MNNAILQREKNSHSDHKQIQMLLTADYLKLRWAVMQEEMLCEGFLFSDLMLILSLDMKSKANYGIITSTAGILLLLQFIISLWNLMRKIWIVIPSFFIPIVISLLSSLFNEKRKQFHAMLLAAFCAFFKYSFGLEIFYEFEELCNEPSWK